MRRVGPRTVGVAAGLLYGLGLIVAGLAGDRLWALYLGFGVVAGIGRGLGWVVPIASATDVLAPNGADDGARTWR